MKISANKFVAVTYDLYVGEGEERELMEKATREVPLKFIYGTGSMIQAFEDALMGLESGAAFDFTITPENAYGLRGDYTILTMYQAEAIEAQEALSNIKIHELVTSKQGNVVISVSETGVTIDTEY